MIVYNYHPITHEYTGYSEADPDPLEDGRWLIPANATTISPPDQITGKSRNFVNGSWCYLDVVTELNFNKQGVLLTAEQLRITEIAGLLDFIDFQSIRPLRAIVAGTQTQSDIDKLEALNEQSEQLRVELSALVSASQQFAQTKDINQQQADLTAKRDETQQGYNKENEV